MFLKPAKRVRIWTAIVGVSSIAFVGCISSDDQQTEERTATRHDRIINGEPFYPIADPANSGVAGILRANGARDLRFTGTATIIAQRKWLLTAGHVMGSIQDAPPKDRVKPASEDLVEGTQIFLGGLQEAWWEFGDEDAGKVPSYSQHPVTQVIFHPDWDPLVDPVVLDQPGIDVALVRVQDELPLSWGDGNDGIDMFDGNSDNLVGTKCLALAFGRGVDTEDPRTAEVLRYATYNILGVVSFEDHRPGSYIATGVNTLSSGVFQYDSSGDSGSTCFDDYGRAVGVLSMTPPGNTIPPDYMAYTKTERYHDWVTRVIAETDERDFTEDDQSDIFVRSRSTGDVSGFAVERAPTNSLDIKLSGPQPLILAKGWTPVGIGSFDLDDDADFVFQCFDGGCTDPRGMVGFYLSGSGAFVRARVPSQLTWDIVGVADIDGDRISDLIWRNTADGRMVYWRVNELYDGLPASQTILPSKAFTGSATAKGPEWEIAAVADFDRYEFLNPEFAIRDTPDILWRNRQTGENRLALMDYWYGTYGVRREFSVTEQPPAFRGAGVGDYNVDGWADTVWQCDTTPCNGGPGNVELVIRLSPHGLTTPDPSKPWTNYEFTSLPAQCVAADKTVSDCVLPPDLEIFGPG